MIPSTKEVAETVRKLIEGVADEVVVRLHGKAGEDRFWNQHLVKAAVMEVWLDWFLGDWTPPPKGVSSTNADSNSPPQGGR